MSFLQNLDWRFAAKQYDSTKPVSSENLDEILRAIRLAPTSYGLQPFHVYVLHNAEQKKRLEPVSDDQELVTKCDVLLVFCARTDIDGMLEDYVAAASEATGKDSADYHNFRRRVEKDLQDFSQEQLFAWSSNQAYLALGFALAACAELYIDSTPIEGFTPEGYVSELNIPAEMTPVVLLAVGYRAAGPKRKKIRQSSQKMFTVLQ